ncbi:YiaA/YiaB family inner membrane protein [Undibacterium sp. Di24W]|uniref:YiaA/YiaB family inner membrane protein n=1 Tax=Undibacterium sp. Di24W TaxID=3413033 RepID=UPI003BF2B262
MATKYIMQRDTNGWRLQVWLSFGLAIVACGAGVVQLPGQELDRAFLALGLFFSLFASFAVAKTVRDNRDGQIDTASWVMTVWIAFCAAVLLTAWGLWRMNIPAWEKNYMLVSWLFLISASFTLAKTLRDAHEVALMERSSVQVQEQEFKVQ